MARLPRKRQFEAPREEDGEQISETGSDPPEDEREKPVRVYADGIYDLFHFGHARSLEQAKKLFPNTCLLVGCCNDEITHRYKGKTVMTEAERYESLRHCRWVDEVIPDAPWVLTQEFIDKHRIDYVAHDSLPYADASGAGKDVYEFVKSIGKFKETKRTDGISTSDVIMRILKDYNQYVMRNLARGYTRKDLGVSYVKEKQLRVNMGITKLRQKVKEHQEKVGKKFSTVAKTAGMHHSEWVENADRWVAGFLEKFEEGCHIMMMVKCWNQLLVFAVILLFGNCHQSQNSGGLEETAIQNANQPSATTSVLMMLFLRLVDILRLKTEEKYN